MSRSVSCPSNCVHLHYAHFEIESECDDTCYDNFQDAIVWFRDQLIEAFPSVSKCDSWIGREDHCVAGNSFATFGISEYCGLVSIWCVPVEAEYYQSAGWEALRDNWIDKIDAKFSKIAKNSFGIAIVKVGTFSNGEAVFRAAS